MKRNLTLCTIYGKELKVAKLIIVLHQGVPPIRVFKVWYFHRDSYNMVWFANFEFSTKTKAEKRMMVKSNLMYPG